MALLNPGIGINGLLYKCGSITYMVGQKVIVTHQGYYVEGYIERLNLRTFRVKPEGRPYFSFYYAAYPIGENGEVVTTPGPGTAGFRCWVQETPPDGFEPIKYAPRPQTRNGKRGR